MSRGHEWRRNVQVKSRRAGFFRIEFQQATNKGKIQPQEETYLQEKGHNAHFEKIGTMGGKGVNQPQQGKGVKKERNDKVRRKNH